jgi:DNA-binding SARP family transcriptional activator
MKRDPVTLVGRFRKKVGSAKCIRVEHGLYSLDHNPTLELHEIERDIAFQSSSERMLDDDTLEKLGSYRARLRRQRPTFLLDSQWFERTERQLRHLERAVSTRLAREALRRREFEVALELSTESLASDPFDEESWEILLRVHLGAGRRGFALAEYHRYECLLHRELGVVPPLLFRQIFSD